MKVLIACEYSGTVRDAFIRAGHDAMSCDLLPTEKPGPQAYADVPMDLESMAKFLAWFEDQDEKPF